MLTMMSVGSFSLIFKSIRPILPIKILGALFLSGCAAWAWKKYDIPVQPDYSCQTGLTSGYEVWVWNCYNNQHIVVYQASSEMSRREAKKEIIRCGERTKIEDELKLNGKESVACNIHYRPPWRIKGE